MTTNNDGWIKMSERKPTWADFPIWIYGREGGHPGPFVRQEFTNHEVYAFWKNASTLPNPPAKELTQREKDGEAFKRWYDTAKYDCVPRDAWETALAYRDKQNREDLRHVAGLCYDTSDSQQSAALADLHRRCGLDT